MNWLTNFVRPRMRAFVRKRDIPATERAQIGNYFAPGFSDTLLLDNNQNERREYVWKKLSVVGDETENIEFH